MPEHNYQSCPSCGRPLQRKQASINRAKRDGLPIYCDRICAGIARRLKNPPKEKERKEAKRIYDSKRREEKRDVIKAKKAAYYAANHDRAKERAYRKANKENHAAYCRRPDYVAWKSEYDRKYRANKLFGEYAEAFILLLNIENEVAERVTRYEIYSTNGTLNKALRRRRAL